ncbi:hypothetical protein C8R46DRAFT_1188062 [Mycena filopes]|nr:hypothetical protein C8R46DRAFT_1188062 [Mycena filopes]
MAPSKLDVQMADAIQVALTLSRPCFHHHLQTGDLATFLKNVPVTAILDMHSIGELGLKQMMLRETAQALIHLALLPTPGSANSPPQAILSKAWTEEDDFESMQEERDVVRFLVPPAVDPMTFEDLEVAALLIPEEEFTLASSTAEELEVEELLILPTLNPMALEELEVAKLLNAGGVVFKFDTDTKYRLVSLPQPTLAARLAHYGRAAREVVGAVVTLANQEVKEFKRTAFDSIKLLEIPLAFYAGFLSTYKREDTPLSTPVTTLEIPPVAVVLPRLPIRRFYSIEPAPSLFKRTSYFRQLKTL